MIKGQTGTLNWGKNETSRVIIVDIDTYSSLPSDVWMEYLDDETHRPLIHPDFGKSPMVKGSILLPEAVVDMVLTPDNERERGIVITSVSDNDYESRLTKYIEKNFPKKNWEESRKSLKKLEEVAGKEYIEKNYLNDR
jgi:hypothetical protein